MIPELSNTLCFLKPALTGLWWWRRFQGACTMTWIWKGSKASSAVSSKSVRHRALRRRLREGSMKTSYIQMKLQFLKTCFQPLRTPCYKSWHASDLLCMYNLLGSSGGMEGFGFEKALDELQSLGVLQYCANIIIDKDSKTTNVVENHPHCRHIKIRYDPGHIKKSLVKQLLKVNYRKCLSVTSCIM